MIQVSTPIEAQSSVQESRHIENQSADFPGWSQKAQKKNKPGIFAKLLDGLTAKVNRPGINTKEAPGYANTGISGVYDEKNGKNALNAASGGKKALGSGIFGENDVFSTVRVVYKQDQPIRDPGDSGGAFTGISRSTKKEAGSGSVRKDFSLANENSLKGPALNNETVRRFAESYSGAREEDGPDAVLNSRTSRSGKGSSAAWSAAADRTKNTGQGNGTQNFLSFSFRELESELLQSQIRKNDLRAESGEKDNSRLSELRGKKGKDRLSIEVRDLRTADGQGLAENGGSRDALAVLRPSNTEVEIPVDLNLSLGRGDGSEPAKTGKESGGRLTFEDALARELHGNLSTDIVRDATVIVRNGGEGTIRLSLRPASLGDVKIRLEMTENKITGHIFVESNEALRAFERELPVLEKAFRDSGFSETNLEMSLTQDGGFFEAGEQRQEGDFQGLSPVQAAALYEAETDWIDVSSDPPQAVQGGIALPAQVNLLV